MRVPLAPSPLGSLLEMVQADLLARGGRRRERRFFPPLGSYSATWSLRSHQGCSPRDREAGNPQVPILQGLGAVRLPESLNGCVKGWPGETVPQQPGWDTLALDPPENRLGIFPGTTFGVSGTPESCRPDLRLMSQGKREDRGDLPQFLHLGNGNDPAFISWHGYWN